MYYRGAQAAIVVYDITNEVSKVSHGVIGISYASNAALQKLGYTGTEE